MFSSFIQNMLNTGGEAAAMQRYVQLHQKIHDKQPTGAPPKSSELSPAQMKAMQAVNAMKQSGAMQHLGGDTQAANPLDSIYPNMGQMGQMGQLGGKNARPFDEILQAQAKVNFGNLLMNPESMKVHAKLVSPETVDAAEKINNAPDKKTSKSHILDLVSKISQKHGVDEKLVQAVIKQESGFNPQATSKAGAMGLMQLMPATAKGLGVTDAYNPVQNVDGGVRYLKSMLQKYNGNVVLALAAYNAGPGAVDKYNTVPPFAETQNYVKSILANYL